MKIISQLYFTFCFFLTCPLNAQVNLIQNGSFEVIDTCPFENGNSFYSSIHHALGWKDASGENAISGNSPDLFNTCNPDLLGVPSNFRGFQNAYDGFGYSGIFIDINYTGLPWRDFIQNELINPTLKGCKYKISFQFSYSSMCSYKTDGLQFILSNKKLAIPNIFAYQNGDYFTFEEDSVTIIRFPEVLNADTSDWWYFEREFYSKEAAKYLTIGSLLDSSQTTSEFGWYVNFPVVDPASCGYFDDIRLIQLDSTCVEDVTGGLEVKEREYFSIYPNPAKGSITISIPNNEEEMLVEFIDISGRIVKTINLNPNNMQVVDVSSISAGWYAVSVTRPISGRFVKPIFIEN